MKLYRVMIEGMCCLFILIICSCGGPISSVTCSLSTPVVQDNQVKVPYIIIEHGDHISYSDTITVKFEVMIKVKNTQTLTTVKRIKNIEEEIDKNKQPFTGYAYFPLTNNEIYVIGSAEIDNFESIHNSGFISKENKKSNNCFNLSRLLSQFLHFC